MFTFCHGVQCNRKHRDRKQKAASLAPNINKPQKVSGKILCVRCLSWGWYFGADESRDGMWRTRSADKQSGRVNLMLNECVYITIAYQIQAIVVLLARLLRKRSSKSWWWFCVFRRGIAMRVAVVAFSVGHKWLGAGCGW